MQAGKRVKILAVLVAAVLLVGGLCLYLPGQQNSENVFTAMDTVVTLCVQGRGSKKISGEIQTATEDLDAKTLSLFNSQSLTARLNGGEEISFPGGVPDFLTESLKLGEASHGAFDITLGTVTALWRQARDTEALPEESALKDALTHAGQGNFILTNNTAQCQNKIQLDFGAVGKGIACDRAKEILQNSHCTRGVCSFGGSILCFGKGEFTVGIRDPKGEASDMAAVLKITAGCVSTSGSYERYFEKDGVVYHHIIDPKTGAPVANDIQSVTVIAQDGFVTDALSTACFVLGVKDSMPLLKQYHAQAVFILSDGRMLYTEGLEGQLTRANESYTLRQIYD